ncbi:hypothetical protein P43SY_000372 [Pythium insidiosum]|uniref:Uncharacterized protein n=1 Tax=Pythium insidiosum TaxID=114742 RepID=A0AAD5Q986_PYTIN|nr:hypothetical protein P43SY_000372 [Pythium insidiosum]
MSNIYITEPGTEGKVLLHTSFGDIDVELWPQQAPKACRNFVQLCLEGYYDNTIFHRIIKDFMVQGGDPTGTGSGGESIYGEPFVDEFHTRLKFNHRGILAMANENKPNSNHSQFFFTLDACEFLNRKHTIFGKITGNTIFNLLSVNDVETDDRDRPLHPPRLLSTEVLWNPFDDIVPRELKPRGAGATDKEAKKRKDRKATKDLKLLSFGDEEAAFEEDTAKETKKKKAKMLSSHDLLEDKKLKAEVDATIAEKLAAVSSDPSAAASASPRAAAAAKKENARLRLKAAVAAAAAKREGRDEAVPPSSEAATVGRDEADNASNDASSAKDKKRKHAPVTDARDEYTRLREELKRSKQAVPLLLGDKARELENARAQHDMLTPLQQQRLKYLERKRATSRTSRQQDTLKKLGLFQSKLATAKQLAASSDAPEKETDTDAYHGQVLEQDDGGDEEDDGKDLSWMTAQLKFKKHIDDQFRNNVGPTPDDYLLIDTRDAKQSTAARADRDRPRERTDADLADFRLLLYDSHRGPVGAFRETSCQVSRLTEYVHGDSHRTVARQLVWRNDMRFATVAPHATGQPQHSTRAPGCARCRIETPAARSTRLDSLDSLEASTWARARDHASPASCTFPLSATMTRRDDVYLSPGGSQAWASSSGVTFEDDASAPRARQPASAVTSHAGRERESCAAPDAVFASVPDSLLSLSGEDGGSIGSSHNYISFFSSPAASPPAPLSNMDLHDLHQLRDHLVKASLVEPAPAVAAGKPSFVMAKAAARPSHFVDLHTSRSTGVGHLGLPRLSSPVLRTARGKGDAMPLPRESVVVLIDAVRQSALPGDDKTRFLFELFDVDNRGVLTREGVASFIDAMLTNNKVRIFADMNVADIVDRLFAQSANPHKMTYHEFHAAFGGAFESSPAAATGGSNGPARGSVHLRRANAASEPKKSCCERMLKQYRQHDSEVHWLLVYVLLMVAAFIAKARLIPYDPAVGYCARIAKGFAQICMVDTLFLLFPMCRSFVQLLRQHAWISSRLPVDQNIEFHKICGIAMLIASLGHSVAWVCIVYYARTVPIEIWAESRFYHLNFVREEELSQLIQHTPIWSGVLMLLIAMVAAPMTHPKFRRGNFNLFWLTHLSFVGFLLLILVHGLAMWVQPPQAYFWVLPPCLLYFVEKRYRVRNMFGGRTSILRVELHKDTTAIFLRKPKNFRFLPGMYLYVNIPIISQFEWHPFTISSAPEDEFLSVHIRKAGDWTGALYALMGQINERHKSNLSVQNTTDTSVSEHLSPYPSIFIDGPMGAPSQEYFRHRTVMFIGAGIGVTPFASILRSIVHQWEAFRCPCCHAVTIPKTFRLQKIYFYWITREQEALTWFSETMNQLAELDTGNRLEIHNYFSPLKDENVIAPLRALQTFIHDTDGQDIISGLATKQVTHFGRPDWKKELDRVAHQTFGRQVDVAQQLLEGATGAHGEEAERMALDRKEDEDVGVYFCGPKPMGNAIHDECTSFNQNKQRRFATVEFDFHSENF